ncbi:MAG: hypothetical protein LBT27_07520 [Prevotellaceae bacterium]|jgi:hypothetical protein|nr:hypothetical protein [Prevotellaceae bacterium]
MDKDLSLWSKTTKKIYTGVLLYSLLGILYAIISPVISLIGGVADFANKAGAEVSVSGLDIFNYILLAGIIIGYLLFFVGLTNFAQILESKDGKAVLGVRNGAILMILASICPLIGLPDILGAIINIVGFILMLLGYSSLKNSATFPSNARVGASNLFTAMILSLIGAIIGIIPLVGGFVNAILSLIAFILVLSGWAKIKNTATKINQ